MESRRLAACEGELVFLVAENPSPQEATEFATTQHGEMSKLKRLCGGGERTLFKKVLSASRDEH